MAKIENIKNIIGSVMRDISSGGASEAGDIWKKAVDGDEKIHSEAVGLNAGKLKVIVDNSMHLQELVLKREKIRRKINVLYPENRVEEIIFRMGKIER